jgi:hypothetical protein
MARIVPPHQERSSFLSDAMLAEAVRQGWITPPALTAADAPPRRPIMPFRELSDELQRDREDR